MSCGQAYSMYNVFIFIGEKLKDILKNLWHAKEEDFPPLQDVCDNMNYDPFLYWMSKMDTKEMILESTDFLGKPKIGLSKTQHFKLCKALRKRK